MPNIPWAVGEDETFRAAGIAGQRHLDTINQWGQIGGQSVALYKLAKKQRQAREDELAAQDEYNRIDGQTADELLKQDEEAERAKRGHNSPSMITSAADDGLHDPDSGGGDSAPGTDKQDVQTSKQQDGSKPESVTQLGATTESSPPPATKAEASADEAKTVEGAADRDPTPKALWRVATDGVEAAGKNVGQFVTRTPEMVADAARTAGGKIANLGGGHFWNDLGSIVGIDDPALGDQRSRLAKFAAQSQMRKEGAQRAAHLAPLAAQLKDPGKAIRTIDPYGMRNMKGLEGMPRADEGDNLNIFKMLLEKYGGADKPGAYHKALKEYVKIERFLNDQKALGRTKDSPLEAAQRIILSPTTSRAEKMRAYEFLEAMKGVGVIRTGAENPAAEALGEKIRGMGGGTPQEQYVPNWDVLAGAGGGGGGAPAPVRDPMRGGMSSTSGPRPPEDFNFLQLPQETQTLALDPRWDAAAKKHGVPSGNFARAIVWHESHFDPTARGQPVPRQGGARAMGMGQIMPETGAPFGMTEENFQDVDRQIDTVNAILADKYRQTGSWDAAIGAYLGRGRDPVTGMTVDAYIPDIKRRIAILQSITNGGGQVASTPAESGAAGAATPEISTVSPSGERTPLGNLAATPPAAPQPQLVMPPGLVNPQAAPPGSSSTTSTGFNPQPPSVMDQATDAIGLRPMGEALGVQTPLPQPPQPMNQTTSQTTTPSTAPPNETEAAAYQRWREEWIRTGQRPAWDYQGFQLSPTPSQVPPS